MAYITTDDVYRSAGISSSVLSEDYVASFIDEAESLVERLLNTSFQPEGVTLTDLYLEGTGTDTIFLPKTPVKSITSLAVSTDGTNYTSITVATKIWWWSTGKVILKNTAEVTVFSDTYPQSVKVTYVYGDTPDPGIKRFTAVVCALSCLTAQIGGTFDDITSYQLPELSASKGEPYTNIRAACERLEKEMNLYLEKYFRPQVAMG